MGGGGAFGVFLLESFHYGSIKISCQFFNAKKYLRGFWGIRCLEITINAVFFPRYINLKNNDCIVQYFILMVFKTVPDQPEF